MFFLVKQGAYALAGVVLLVALSRLDYRRLRPLAPALLIAALVLCVAVLLVAPPINGARRWFLVGPVSFQPSELAKIALLHLARLAPLPPTGASDDGRADEAGRARGRGLRGADRRRARPRDDDRADDHGVLRPPRRRRPAPPVRCSPQRCALALGALAIWIEPYRRERFLAFLDPWRDAEGSGFQSVQAIIGIGSGGIAGNGLGEGVQKIFYLPEAHTDMIFAIIGEEVGLVGATAVIGAFAVFMWAGFRVALACPDRFGTLLAAGITALVCGQAAVNLAAVLGIAPLTGIPLPFVSYGGSSLVVLLAAVGILLNIAVNERVAEARVSDRSRGDSRSRTAGARGRGGAARARSDGDVRRDPRPRRVAAGS